MLGTCWDRVRALETQLCEVQFMGFAHEELVTKTKFALLGAHVYAWEVRKDNVSTSRTHTHASKVHGNTKRPLASIKEYYAHTRKARTFVGGAHAELVLYRVVLNFLKTLF